MSLCKDAAVPSGSRWKDFLIAVSLCLMGATVSARAEPYYAWVDATAVSQTLVEPAPMTADATVRDAFGHGEVVAALEEPPWSDEGVVPASADAGWSEPLYEPVADPHPLAACESGCVEPWTHQMLPAGLLYKSYLAGVKESRISSTWNWGGDGLGGVWDSTLGGRVGLWRYGPRGPFANAGWQIDLEGAALVRLDFDGKQDLIGTDYRFGVPITWRDGPLAVKFGYYHISSHVGDEWLIKNPTHVRINYVRESAIVGVSYDMTPDVRVYGELGYAFARSGGAEPIEVQFGIEYSPFVFDSRGAPFAAANVHLREDVDFGGNLTLQSGWQWRGIDTNHLFRVGAQYYNGKSSQYSFYDTFEQTLGFGIWFDY